MTENQKSVIKAWLQYHAEHDRQYLVRQLKKVTLLIIPVEYEVI